MISSKGIRLGVLDNIEQSMASHQPGLWMVGIGTISQLPT